MPEFFYYHVVRDEHSVLEVIVGIRDDELESITPEELRARALAKATDWDAAVKTAIYKVYTAAEMEARREEARLFREAIARRTEAHVPAKRTNNGGGRKPRRGGSY